MMLIETEWSRAVLTWGEEKGSVSRCILIVFVFVFVSHALPDLVLPGVRELREASAAAHRKCFDRHHVMLVGGCITRCGGMGGRVYDTQLRPFRACEEVGV